MEILEVYSPAGATEITRLHAPRLDSLEGKTIALLSNDSWQAHRTLPLVREILQGRYPTATFVPASELPMGNKNIDSAETVERLKERGVQAVIVGNAA